MWTIFKKEFRQGILILATALAVIILGPFIGELLAPKFWDRVITDEVRLSFIFGLLPIYMILLAVGMMKSENLVLLKNLPIPPWRIAVGKLLWLGFNLLVLGAGGLSSLIHSGPLKGIMTLDPYVVSLVSIFSLASLVFALNIVLKKSMYAVFLALFLFLICIPSQIHRISPLNKTSPGNFALLFLAGLVYLMPIPAGIHFFHRLLRNKPLIGRALIFCCLYPLFFFFSMLTESKANLSAKAIPLGNLWDWKQVSDSEYCLPTNNAPLLILLDIHSGLIKNIKVSDWFRMGSQGEPENHRYYYYNLNSAKSERGKPYYEWSALDVNTGIAQKLGFLPPIAWMQDDIGAWNVNGNRECTFGFVNFQTGSRFESHEHGLQNLVRCASGLLYAQKQGGKKIWFFTDFANAATREAFRGKYVEAELSWSYRVCAYLNRGRTLLQWCPPAGYVREIGDYDLKMELSASTLLVGNSSGGETTLFLWKEGRIAGQRSFPYKDMSSVKPLFQRAENSVLMECEVPSPGQDTFSLSTIFGVIKVKDQYLEWIPLPQEARNARKVYGSDEVLIDIMKDKVPSHYLYSLSEGALIKLP